MKKITKIITIMLYILLINLILSLLFIYYFEKKLGNDLIQCGENQVKYIANIIINTSIKNYLDNEEKINFLIKEENLIRYNTKQINKTTTNITRLIENNLQKMIKGNIKDINIYQDKITQEYYEKLNDGIIYTVSIGTATGSSLLSNLGPKIPLKLKLVGETTTNIESNVKEYGLNNALVEINAIVKTTINIQMPFLSKEIPITNKIPLTMEIIQGNIPEYYIGNYK